MFAALTPADALSAPFSGPHTMRYRGFTLSVRPSAGGFRWAIHHDGLLLHADGGLHPTSAAAARAARAHVDDALAAFDAAISASHGSFSLGLA